MKKTFFLIIFFVLSSLTKAQNFFVGDTSCNYVLVNATVSRPSTSSTTYSFVSSYSLDVDNDTSNDLVFDWEWHGVNGGSSSYNAGSLKCNSPNNYDLVYYPGTINCPSSPASLVSNLSYGSPLKAGLNWINPPNSIVYAYCLGWLSCNGFCGNYYPMGPNSVYVGFRKVLTNDTIYGWILLNTNSSPGSDKIISYAVRHTATTSSITPVFTNSITSVCAGNSLTLTGSPTGGSFLGLGISGNTFTSSATATTSIYNVYYTIGCAMPAALNVTVNALPKPSITNSLTSVCNGDSLVLIASPSGGIFSGTGVSGNIFQSSVTGTGVTTVNYSYTDMNSCSNTTSVNLNVVTVPILSISISPTVLCSGIPATITASGAATYTWSNGANTSSIVISPTTNISYTVTGAFTSSACPSGSVAYSNTVVVAPVVTASINSNIICQGDYGTITLSGTAPYINLYDSATFTNITTIVSQSVNVFPPSNMTYGVRVFYGVSCYYDLFIPVKVISCVGIRENQIENNFFKIFPNPNNGEFEIKGTKEETIYISNELGQLIETKYISAQNNYSIKINDFQNGVYFVGNKISRQKVVVIK